MYSTDQQVLGVACRWAAAGQRFALVTVARTWGSAPRPPGALMALRHDGLVEGSVSGGCVEDDLIERMHAGAFNGRAPLRLVYGVTKDEATRFGLPCGGTLELVVEPAPDAVQLRQLDARLAARGLAARRVDLLTGKVTVEDASRDDVLHWDGLCLTTVHGPRWRLLIIGAGQVSRYLAQMALALDYEIIVCDPRDEYGQGWDVAGTRLLTTMPDDTVTALKLDARSAVVALTHDPKLDDLAMLEALRSPAFYVGALGSYVANQRRRERLLQHFDMSQAEIERLHGPVGIAIGSKTPPEIAVSILAEMIAVRNGSPIATGRSDTTRSDAHMDA
ncbi:MAG: XdhC family protein [Pseudomonadota bacterium]